MMGWQNCITFINIWVVCYSVNPCKEPYNLTHDFALIMVTEILMQLKLQVENIFHVFEMR